MAGGSFDVLMRNTGKSKISCNGFKSQSTRVSEADSRVYFIGGLLTQLFSALPLRSSASLRLKSCEKIHRGGAELAKKAQWEDPAEKCSTSGTTSGSDRPSTLGWLEVAANLSAFGVDSLAGRYRSRF